MPVFVPNRDSDVAVFILRTKTGGGGIRTPVPKRFKTGFYMFSWSFVSRLAERRSTGFQLSQFVNIFRTALTNSHAELSRILTPLRNWQEQFRRTGA